MASCGCVPLRPSRSGSVWPRMQCFSVTVRPASNGRMQLDLTLDLAFSLNTFPYICLSVHVCSECSVTFLPPNRYSKLMGDEPDLDPDINKDFFENNVLQLDPSLLTENGMKCFERFFKAVNCREGKLVAKRRAYMMDDLELIGLDYLWRVRRCVATDAHKWIFLFIGKGGRWF